MPCTPHEFDKTLRPWTFIQLGSMYDADSRWLQLSAEPKRPITSEGLQTSVAKSDSDGTTNENDVLWNSNSRLSLNPTPKHPKFG